MTSSEKQPLTWFITGASTGFGLALTRLALARGHKVIATSRDPSRVPELVAEVRQKGGDWLSLNVDDGAAHEVIGRLEAQGTAIDVLVNNAGRSLHGPAESIAEDEVRSQMETQYFGPYRLIRAVVPHMRARRRGLILNFGSGAGVNGRDSMGAYAASKAAMDGKNLRGDSNEEFVMLTDTHCTGLLRVMSKELKPYNVRTLNVLLGAFDTGFGGSRLLTKTPFPDSYRGSMTETIVHALEKGAYKLDGDHLKAAQVILDMVVGEGIGEGKEWETVMPLGRDMWASLEQVKERNEHMMETFREVCNNVYVED